MPDHRWPVKVYKWDIAMKHEGWAKESRHVLAYSDQLHDTTDIWQVFDVDVDVVESKLKFLNREDLWQEAHTKTK